MFHDPSTIEFRPVHPSFFSRLCEKWKIKRHALIVILVLVAVIGISLLIYVLENNRHPLEITTLPSFAETSDSSETETPPVSFSSPVEEEPLAYTPAPENPIRKDDKVEEPSSRRLLAFIALQNAIYSGKPFVDALDSFLFSASQDAFIQKQGRMLQMAATKGMPDMFRLQSQLHRLAGSVVAVSKDPASLTGMERILSALSPWLRIRETGEAVLNADSAEGWIEQAEMAVARHDIGVALEWLRKLPVPAQDILKEWLQEAEARLAVEKALENVRIYLETPSP